MARQMKDSGIEWIGEIPKGWRTCKIKDIFQVFSGATPKSEQPEYWDGDIIWVTPADYKTNEKFVSFGKRTITQAGYDSCGTTLVPAGSIVFSKRAPIGSVAIAKVPLCTNQGCLSCINKGEADTTFFYYVMSIFTEIFELYGSGTTFKELSYDSFAAFAMTNPPLAEQHRIADFLDRRCAEIDAVMERTKATIEEYKKLKQAVITEAVTKGVRGPRKMKDSGIEWIGEIPEGWGVVRKLSYRCDTGISYGIVKLFDPDDENGVKVLRCSDVYPGGVSLNNVRTVTQEVANEYRRTLLKGGEVIIAVRGSLGGCAVVTPDLIGYNVAREVAVIPLSRGIFNKYVMYYLLSDMFNNYRDSHLLGSVYVGLNIELLSACSIAEPPYNEQVEIVEYLDKKCVALDNLIAKKTALLTELETYKKSMIYEYVTGKKEVV